jgi:hypothetical protein
MRSQKIRRGRFNRALLPDPLTVLNQLGIQPGKPSHRGYWRFCCPFHKNGNESNPSFNLHHIGGHYRCHACGAKGRDILDLYMRITGKQFIDASIALGAWENCIC